MASHMALVAVGPAARLRPLGLWRRSAGLPRYCDMYSYSVNNFCRRLSSTTATGGDMTVSFSTGKYARLADGAVLVESGNASVLVTAVSKTAALAGTPFIPLQVDYRERASAAGKIPINFLRREMRSSDREILISRFIDRSLRPLFPEGYAYNTQIICNVLAADGHTDPEVMSINGAAAALMLSDIPWAGPVAATRVGMVDDKLVVNPSVKSLTNSPLNLIVTCTTDKIVMVEGLAKEIPEDQFCEAVLLGLKSSQNMFESLIALKQIGKPVRNADLIVPSASLTESVSEFCREKILNIYRNTDHMKASRDKELFNLIDVVTKKITEDADPETKPPSSFLVQQAFWNTCKLCMQSLILDEQRRVDGRAMTELRPIECEVDLFDGLHGSAVFRRGETQVLCTVTFDSQSSAAKADNISKFIGGQGVKKFMLHYDFPPFATNETGIFLLSGRREIGHGALAEKAIQQLLPEDFPFTIRLSSQVTDSNGSSSMATVCGGSLALFDAGVQISKPVAGVACGLILDNDSGRYQILSDLSGIEDATGNMDFKMAGTRDGITSCQVDLKGCHGISYELFQEAVKQSREARLSILDTMDRCQSSPRTALKENGPVSETIIFPAFRRFKLFGSGGYKIKKLLEDTGVEMDVVDDMQISLFAPSAKLLEEFKKEIDSIASSQGVSELQPGAMYNAMIVEVQENGMFIEMVPGGVIVFLPSSQIQSKFIGHPGTLGYKPGQEVTVKYFGRDPVTGQLQVSKKALSIPPLSGISEYQTQMDHQLLPQERTSSHNSVEKSSSSNTRKYRRRTNGSENKQWWDEEQSSNAKQQK